MKRNNILANRSVNSDKKQSKIEKPEQDKPTKKPSFRESVMRLRSR